MKKHALISMIAFAWITVLASCGGGGGGGGCSLAEADSCGEGKFCNFLDLSCGAAGGEGTCMEIPASCPATVSAVCTCDHISFDNECFASQSGQSVQSTGAC